MQLRSGLILSSTTYETQHYETQDYETQDYETQDYETQDYETQDYETQDCETLSSLSSASYTPPASARHKAETRRFSAENLQVLPFASFLEKRISAASNIRYLYSNTTKTYWVELSRTLIELYSEIIEYYDDLYDEYKNIGYDEQFVSVIRIFAQKAIIFKLTLMDAMVNYHFKRSDRYAICLAIQEINVFLAKAGGLLNMDYLAAS